jgi:tetratricopeptide (TPR) repeat protein
MKKTFDLMQFVNGLVLASLSIFISTGAFAQDDEIKKAEKFLDEDKKKKAVETLVKATQNFPMAANLYYYLGRAQLIVGDKESAKKAFDKGVEMNAKEPLNFVGQGRIQLMNKNVTQAKASFDKAIAMGKKNIKTLDAIAEAYLTDKAYEKDAMALLQKSKELKEEVAETHLLLGDAFLMENNGGSAASAYERASELDPSDGLPWFKLGELFARSKNVPMAEEKYLKAVAVDPEFAYAHRELGELYYLKKDGPKAVKHYKQYLDLTDSPEKDDRFRYAFFLFMAKDYDESNKEFEEQSKKPDVSSNTLKFYTRSLANAGNLAKSQEIFERYLKHKDTKPDADDYNAYAELLKKQGKDSLAMNAYETSISVDQNQNDILQTLIKYHFDKKKYSSCEKFCRISLKTRKTPNPNDYFYLGRAQYYQQKYSSSDSTFAKLNEIQPKFILGYLWAARSKNAQDGDFNDPKAKIEWLAKPAYEKLIEVGETDKEKNKKELIDAYKYLVGHYLSKQDFPKGKEYLGKILELDPENIDAKQALKDINNPQPQQKRKK